MLTDKQLAQLQLEIYEPSTVWDQYEDGSNDNCVVWAARRIDGVTVIVMRGSYTIRDWIRDACAFTVPFIHGKFGPLHPGFSRGMEIAWTEIKNRTIGPYVVIGHSLGAARVAILTAMMVADGQAPLARVVWGEPKAGFQQLATFIASVPSRSYRNGDTHHHDLVTDLPFSFPPEEYVRCSHAIDVCAAPTADHRLFLGHFAWHHMDLYAKATPMVNTL